LPEPIRRLIKTLRRYKTHLWRREDLFPIFSFLAGHIPKVSLIDKMRIVKKLYVISSSIHSPHTQAEMLSFIRTILSLPPEIDGVIVEAGCFKGGSTAKFSLAADIAQRTLVVFDSFEGIPDNDEPHDKTIFGGQTGFKKGDYCGSLEEVKRNVVLFGKVSCCRFIKGWFDETMPGFKESIAAVYLDVDLALSTRTCLKYLYPLLREGGVLYSQDGHLPLVLDVFKNDEFWLKDVGFRKPTIHGFGRKKLIWTVKERS
jgi:O-methyltransferase